MTQKIPLMEQHRRITFGVEALTQEGLQREELNEVPGDRTPSARYSNPCLQRNVRVCKGTVPP